MLMRIFVAGATGAIGRRLVPLLVAGGHHVVGTTRRPQKTETLRAQGADAVVVDGLHREAVIKAVAAARPDVVVHQMTALTNLRNLKKFDDEFALTNRLRTEGTDNLIAAAHEAGVRRIVVQSYAGWPNIRSGSRVKTEDDPLDSRPPAAMAQSLKAIRHVESVVPAVTDTVGIVLRYGSLYGPGTSIALDGDIVAAVRRRMFPVFGEGGGVWSFAHVDDVAEATRLAIERGVPGIFNIVDDEPAEVALWLPGVPSVLSRRAICRSGSGDGSSATRAFR
jgi:nucleoside-diphosphate-sugar epimerase